MDLNVTITLSDQLFTLLEDKLPNLGRRIEKSVEKEVGKEVRKGTNVSVTVNATPSEIPGMPENPDTIEPAPAESPVAVSVEPASTPAPTPPPVETPSPAPAAPAVPTLEDCRAALHRARVRFEGENYKDKSSEGHAKYHQAVTNQVKQIIISVSSGAAEKIPALPEECRAAFIAELDALILDEKGQITAPPAPF